MNEIERYAAQLEADQAVRDHVEAWFDPQVPTSTVFLLKGYRYAAERLTEETWSWMS